MIASGKKNTYRQYPGLMGRLKQGLARFGLGRVDHLEVASEMAADMYERQFGMASDDISVVTHIGVDTRVFRPAESRRTEPGEPLVVGYCGQFSRHKGLDSLVEAARRARADGLDLRLELLGDGPMRAELEQVALEEGSIILRNPVPSDQVAHFMNGLDIYVLPALILPDHQEHDAHALLQALACGIASDGTRSGIIPEILGTTWDFGSARRCSSVGSCP